MTCLSPQNTWFGLSSNLEATSTSFAPHRPLVSLASTQLKSAILKLRWIGQDEEADRLLLDLAGCGPSEIFPMAPMETD